MLNIWMEKESMFQLHDFMGWHCACCDGFITSVENGWVEWLASEDDNGSTILSGLRLVHRTAGQAGAPGQSCRYDPRKEFRNSRNIVEGLALESLVGADGLMALLSFLASGDFAKEEEILELTKRLHIPGYELTCNLLRQKIVSRDPNPFLGAGYYLQSEIQEVIQEGRSKHPFLVRSDRNKQATGTRAGVRAAASRNAPEKGTAEAKMRRTTWKTR